MSFSDMLNIAGCTVAIILFIVQVSPLEFKPLSYIAKSFGNIINQDIICTLDERYAISSRVRILSFNDELLLNVKHSKGYFDQILMDIDTYEEYCLKHPDFKNSITVSAVENIKDHYENCIKNNNFL